MVANYLCNMLHLKLNPNNNNPTVRRRISLSRQYRLSQQDLSSEPVDICVDNVFWRVDIDDSDDTSGDHDFTSNIKSMIFNVSKIISLYLI